MEWCRFVTYLWNDPRINYFTVYISVKRAFFAFLTSSYYIINYNDITCTTNHRNTERTYILPIYRQ